MRVRKSLSLILAVIMMLMMKTSSLASNGYFMSIPVTVTMNSPTGNYAVVIKKTDSNAPRLILPADTEEIVKMFLTDEKKELLKQGYNITTEITESAPDYKKAVNIIKKNPEIYKKTKKCSSHMAVEISVSEHIKKMDSNEETVNYITEIPGTIEMVFPAPEKMNKDTAKMVHVHPENEDNGTYEVSEVSMTYNEKSNTVSIKTSKFSTFVLYYAKADGKTPKSEEPKEEEKKETTESSSASTTVQTNKTNAIPIVESAVQGAKNLAERIGHQTSDDTDILRHIIIIIATVIILITAIIIEINNRRKKK